MASASRELHPALQFLKDNAVVVGLVLVVAASIAVFAISQASASSAPAAAPSPHPTAMPTVGLGSSTQAPSAPSAGSAKGLTGTGSTLASSGAQAGAQPSSASATASPTMAPVNAGTSPQGVKVKDWHTAAEGFSAAWANTAGGKDAWLARIKPFVTPALYAQFGLTDVRNIAPDTLDHVTLGDEAGAQKSFHAWFTSGGHRFDGLLGVQNDGTWLVAEIASPKG